MRLKPRVTDTDHNGYMITTNGSLGVERHEVFTPSGVLVNDYRSKDTAFSAADRHFRELNEVITLRPCMNFDNCGTHFESTWKGHRLCDKCKTRTGGLI